MSASSLFAFPVAKYVLSSSNICTPESNFPSMNYSVIRLQLTIKKKIIFMTLSVENSLNHPPPSYTIQVKSVGNGWEKINSTSMKVSLTNDVGDENRQL